MRNKERFVKRRQRLIGPDGATLKALELLTECYILVQGNTVAVMGSVKGIKRAREVVIDCMNNIHPVYNIKRLMIMKELAKDPKLATEDWSRFLPSFKKKNVQRKKPKNKRIKGSYTPFPPEQMQSKIDKQLDSGEYFLSERQRKAKKLEEKQQESIKRSIEKRMDKEKEFEAPTRRSSAKVPTSSESTNLDIDKLKEKFSAAGSKRKTSSSGNTNDTSDFVDTGKSKKKKKKRIKE